MPKEYFLTLDMLRFTRGALRNIIFYMNNITQELWSTLYFNHCLVVWNISLDKCVSILDISKTESFKMCSYTMYVTIFTHFDHCVWKKITYITTEMLVLSVKFPYWLSFGASLWSLLSWSATFWFWA